MNFSVLANLIVLARAQPRVRPEEEVTVRSGAAGVLSRL